MKILLSILLVSLLYVNLTLAFDEGFLKHLWNNFKKTHGKTDWIDDCIVSLLVKF